MKRAPLSFAAISAAFLPSVATAQTTFNEVEPNGPKAEATAAVCLASGDKLSGTTTGTSTTAASTLATTADTFLVQTCAAPLAIYKHQLVLTTTGAAGHTGTIRGLNQTGTVGVGGTAGTTDTVVQTSSATATTPPRMNQWYGFGKSEQIYYRVTGTATTTGTYDATLTTTTVTPVVVGPFAPGPITISSLGQGHTNDTDFWLYDSNLNAIPGWGNDDHFMGTVHGLGSSMTRTFAAGTYYLALSQFNVSNNQTAANDDDFVTAPLLDFPDAVAQSTTTANVNVAFAITDSAGTTPIAATKPSGYEIVWVQINVGGGAFTAFCGNGDPNVTQPCQGPAGNPGKGCDNSAGTGGALLTGSGNPVADTHVLTSSGELPSSLSIFIQCTGTIPQGVQFGDGIRCIQGNLKRLYVKNATGGVVSAPTGADPTIQVQSANLGDPIGAGQQRHYQVYYRDPASFSGLNFNVSSALTAQY